MAPRELVGIVSCASGRSSFFELSPSFFHLDAFAADCVCTVAFRTVPPGDVVWRIWKRAR